MGERETSGTQELPTLGFLGLGQMGGAMVGTLVRAGYDVLAYDPKPEALEAAVSKGAEAAAGEAEVVARGEVVLTSLRSSAMFVQVAEASLVPDARRGQTFIDMGTTEAREARRLAAEFSAKGAALLDAPVSGGSGGSASGTLHIFAGGDKAVYERCLPILHVLGEPRHVVFCGPSGTGQIVKGVNQLAMGLVDAAYVEAIAYGVMGGADPQAILEGVGGDEGFRAHLAAITRMVIDGRADDVLIKFPEFPYYLGEAKEQGFDMPMTRGLFDFLDTAPRDWVDNMNRPRVAYWHELINRAKTK